MVWTVIGWTLLGLLALLVLALVLPTVITVDLSLRGLKIWVRVLFVRVQIFPLKPRKAKPQKPAKATAEEPPEKAAKKKPPKTFAQRVAFMKRLIKSGTKAGHVFLRHMRIRKVQLVVPVYGGDASETAIWCGRAQGAVGTLRAVLESHFKIRFSRIQIIPDFAGQLQEEWYFACKVAFNPVIMFKAGFVFFKEFLRKKPYSKAAYKRALAQKRAGQAANGGQKRAA